MAGPSSTVDQNLLPVQAYFDVYGNFQTFIGQGQPFYATFNPIQSGLTITNSTINSSSIGATSPSTGIFTNVSATTGQIATTPSGSTDIANKFYVDTVAQGLGPKAACQCATTANITLSGLQTIDGYTTLAGDRILVKNQSSSQFNGIYIASASAWTRAVDMDVWAEVPGAYTVVLNGGQLDTGWVCTASATGTINVTAMPWVQFAANSTYFAGTGLSLSSNTFSITPVGTAGTYGSASAVPVFVTNASGQVTSVTNTSIAISNTQVSGLGTMSVQNASSVAITGGSIDSTTIGATTASTVRGTTITATTQFTGAGTGLTGTATSLSIGGNAATATTATTASSVTNSVTFNNSGTGGASGSTFNGGTALTVSYNTVGAPSTTGTGASGTWGISVTGNAGTVTNGVYTTGSYSNPAWITSILGSIVSGNISGNAANVTGTVAASNGGTGISGTLTGISYMNGTSAHTAATAAQIVSAIGSTAVTNATNAASATSSYNLFNGVAGAIPWQSALNTTGFTAAGTTGQVLTSGGTGAPTWTTPTSYATVTDDTTTAATRYPLFANQTSGNLSTEYTSSTKLQYNPSTGIFTSTGFNGGAYVATETITGSLNAGAFSYGTLSYSDVNIFASYTSSVNNYNQIVLQNTNSGSSASSDYVVSNNLGTNTTYYGDFGMNSSGWTGTIGTASLSAPNVVYFSSASVDLVIGTVTANAIRFVTNGAADNASVSSAGVWTFANTVTASISGNAGTATTATTATNATNLAITDDTTTNSDYYVTFVSASSGNTGMKTSSTKLKYHPSTGALTASTIYIAP